VAKRRSSSHAIKRNSPNSLRLPVCSSCETLANGSQRFLTYGVDLEEFGGSRRYATVGFPPRQRSGALLKRCTSKGYRGFESLPHRCFSHLRRKGTKTTTLVTGQGLRRQIGHRFPAVHEWRTHRQTRPESSPGASECHRGRVIRCNLDLKTG
jgi:hypothetical protein